MKVIGLGPGEPELITVRAMRELESAKVVYVPKSASSEQSLARRIVEKYSRAEVVELEFKMGGSNYEELSRLVEKDGVYAILGDPALYSTFAKLRPYIKRPVEYIPGVSAMSSCLLKMGEVLAVGHQAVAIVPAARSELLRKAVELFDVVVVVKANKNIDLINSLAAGRRALAVRRCYLEGERYADRVEWSDYFTTVYIWR